MQIQTRAKITLSFSDITAAITAYVTQNGFPITEDDLVDTKGLPDTLEILVDSDAPIAAQQAAPAKQPTKAQTKAKEEPKQPAAAKPEDDTMVPANDIAAYRAKKEAEAAAKAEAKKKVEFDPAKMLTNDDEAQHSDGFDDDDGPQENDSVADQTSSPSSIFDDEEPTKKPSASIFDDDKPAAKPTESIFA
ncbi:hypothetical protein [Acinetobacter baumannii]|uniref:hypothetical protein n=1 Tax=Acinetobacter baumannii TaxID=470 RepID=UPI0026DEC7D7|nr:hypothetical protein [Acinetobacter baumannii]MDO5926310.1 hypothetical protein [Acinetobacter baumannii]